MTASTITTTQVAAHKQQLRKALLERRDALPPNVRESASQAITERVIGLAAFRQARTVLLTMSIKTEWNTTALIQHVLGAGKRLVLPRMLRDTHELACHAVTNLDRDLVQGVWGIREPDPSVCLRLSPEELNLVVTPGIAFDREGYRLGYGAGYFDRLFQSAPQAERVGAVFSDLLVNTLPREPHDVAVQWLITESATYNIRDEAWTHRGQQ